MKTTTIERPANTLTKHYLENKAGIYRWREENAEAYKAYNREYQRKLRADPAKYEQIRSRCDLRAYLTGKHDTSFKMVSRIGMDRAGLAAREGLTEAEFLTMLKTSEIDHIISASWFDDEKYEHLKPFIYRHYNLQFVKKLTNRTKHSYVDLDDIRVQYVIAMMELDYLSSKHDISTDNIFRIHDLNNKILKLVRRIKKKYK